MSLAPAPAPPESPFEQQFWNPYQASLEEGNGQWGFWSAAVDKRSAKASPETPSDPNYTQAQILREKSILLRSRQANRQRGTPEVHTEAFFALWEAPPEPLDVASPAS